MANSPDILTAYRLDKSAFSSSDLGDDSADIAYWHSKTPQERIAAIEYLRTLNYGHAATTARLQRVLTVTELGES